MCLLVEILFLGSISNYQCQSTCTTVTDDMNNPFHSVVGSMTSNSDVTYKLVYLLLLLLLSGDIEVNPGPMIDDQPSCNKFVKYLKPLVDWKPFALCLPGITQSNVNIIDKRKLNVIAAIHQIWLKVNPQASWRDVINALKQCKENELARTIEDKVTDPTAGRSTNDDMEVSTSNANPGPITGKHTLNTTLIN